MEDLTREVLGAAFQVSNSLGHGFVEKVYQRALVCELEERRIPFATEVPFEISYRGRSVGTYVADLIVARKVIVELKAVETLTSAHTGQVLNYLRASGCSLGLLLNFGKPKLEYRRVIL